MDILISYQGTLETGQTFHGHAFTEVERLDRVHLEASVLFIKGEIKNQTGSDVRGTITIAFVTPLQPGISDSQSLAENIVNVMSDGDLT